MIEEGPPEESPVPVQRKSNSKEGDEEQGDLTLEQKVKAFAMNFTPEKLKETFTVEKMKETLKIPPHVRIPLIEAKKGSILDTFRYKVPCLTSCFPCSL
jgi:hypothetical protein